MTGTSVATPPTPEWRSWERIARDEGAAGVRDYYHQSLDAMRRDLDFLPNDPSLDIFIQRLVLTASMMEYIESWSLVEARDIHDGTNTRARFDDTAWPQLINYTAAMLKGCEDLLTQSRAVKATRAANDEPHWALTMADHLDVNVDSVAWRLALLGKTANDSERVRQVFSLFGRRIRTYATSESFMAAEHDLARLIRAKRKPDARASQVTRRVSIARQASARTFITQFFVAIEASSDLPLRRMIADLEYPVALSAGALTTKLSGADYASARFGFEGLGRNEFVVRVKGVVTDRGTGRDRVLHARNLAFGFRFVDDDLQLFSIGGL